MSIIYDRSVGSDLDQGTFQCEEGTWYTADGPEPAQAEME